MKKYLKTEFMLFKVFIRNVPSIIVALFIVSIIAMNLLANKSINLPFSWLALDAGILLSWLSFLTMDIITKHYGPKAATELAILGILINLGVALIFFIASAIPGLWGESFVEEGGNLINNALNNTFSGTWYVLLGSTTAFLASAIVNNLINYLIGKLFKKDNFFVFILRTYISTAIGQFIDNLVFAFIVSYFFFGWTIIQCLTCALTGAIVELLCEVIFSPLGYKIVQSWKKEGVGKEYLTLLTKEEN
ncbi:MAG: VUT family protein [Bacillales bacterium]|nr:VUT family protein [Bacillales bacterium]